MYKLDIFKKKIVFENFKQAGNILFLVRYYVIHFKFMIPVKF